MIEIRSLLQKLVDDYSKCREISSEFRKSVVFISNYEDFFIDICIVQLISESYRRLC